jgi:hypothetical protein
MSSRQRTGSGGVATGLATALAEALAAGELDAGAFSAGTVHAKSSTHTSQNPMRIAQLAHPRPCFRI